MDSFGDTLELNDYTALQIASLVKTNRSQIVIHKLPAQTQSGVHDCGLFAIAYAMEACLGNLLGSTTEKCTAVVAQNTSDSFLMW